MNEALLIDMFYAAPELWYTLGLGLAVLLILMGAQGINILKLWQKNYFLNRDRERYAETLYASKDGYFAFIYPDEKVNDPCKTVKERCSRRLAVLMNLPGGTASVFEDILNRFTREDAGKIRKYVACLKEDGISFEDEFVLKNSNRHLNLSGSRINGQDGNVYCDMIWFRDVSRETNKIDYLEEEKKQAFDKIRQLEDLIDNLAYPVWLRDEKLRLVLVNKKYQEFTRESSKEDIIAKQAEIMSVNNESVSGNLALQAQAANRTRKQTVRVIKDGERRSYEAIEAPFHAEQSLDKICLAGALIDVTELDELKRNFKLHQDAHLEILGTLGTAFAVFNNNFKLAFYNKSFASFWGLEDIWLESQPSYAAFLDVIREKRMLPEVPDFRLYKADEQKDFSTIIEPKEDLLHLPNGNTIRRVRAPHPMGGLIFAFEDVSDRLATRRAYNSLLAVQQEVLDNLFDGVVIFGSNGRLKFYNQAYLKLWSLPEIFLQKEPSIAELWDAHQRYFGNVEDWQALKNDIITHLMNATTKTFRLVRSDNSSVEVLSSLLSDGSIMVTCQKTADNR